MARKILDFQIPGTRTDEVGQRDCGKTFRITEMPADQAERWAVRAFLILAESGVDVGNLDDSPSMAGIAALGFQALRKVDPDRVQPLLDEMLACVVYVPELAGAPVQKILPGASSQIEDVGTRMILRRAVFELHTGFSLAG